MDMTKNTQKCKALVVGGPPSKQSDALLMEHDHAQRNRTFIKSKGIITEFCGQLIRWLTISLSLLTPLILLAINH